jgi:ATP-dependent DNA helicase RecQ
LPKIVFFDIETDKSGKNVYDIGAISDENSEFHENNPLAFSLFIKNTEYLCGHNIFEHDLNFVRDAVFSASVDRFIDTLYFSPLLFPNKPYHKLGKQYKIISEEELNNPYLDSVLAKNLFYDEVSRFNELDAQLKRIFYALLCDKVEFADFFRYVGFEEKGDCCKDIKSYFSAKICENTDISKYVNESPVELAYSLALINTEEKHSLTPLWVLEKYPQVENIIYHFRSLPCHEKCEYCSNKLDGKMGLKRFFKYTNFRTSDGVSLQEQSVVAALEGKSFLTILPTGGGKSIAFQLPALMQGESVRGLTVVISPLQSLMKDQVDNLEKIEIANAFTINGALDPIERARAFECVENGVATLLYISPESLRLKSIETILLKRNIVRFVIDEAHCFSSWGQDFRVDYLYIGDFICEYKKKKKLSKCIPVSCFTATARLRVISDIKKYFMEKLELDLELFTSAEQRKNLTYQVFNKGANEKYQYLRTLLSDDDGPAIIYVSRTKNTKIIAEALNSDGVRGGAVYYHGKMDREERIKNQEKFMNGECRIIVATSAFGMGVDKSDVSIVIHYDISPSLEDYVQEAGRAGRNESMQAKCFILFDKEDLNKHFILLNQTKISIKEIQQVWTAIKKITKKHTSVSRSALEIAREAGWNDEIGDTETRARTAISALEDAQFVKRGLNSPRVFATSIRVATMADAAKLIDNSSHFESDKAKLDASRIISRLISAKSTYKSLTSNTDGESRVDYLSDRLAIPKENVIRTINTLREEQILSDEKDLVVYIKTSDERELYEKLEIYFKIEKLLVDKLKQTEEPFNLREMNLPSQQQVSKTSIQKIKTIFNLYVVLNLITRSPSDIKDTCIVKSNYSSEDLLHKYEHRINLIKFIAKYLFSKMRNQHTKSDKEEIDIDFSCLELKAAYEANLMSIKTSFADIDDALFYLSKTGILRLDGAFLVSYNAMRVERTERDSNRSYIKKDYEKFEKYYENKIQQIHIVGEYATRMTNDYPNALQYADDYFKIDYDDFLKKYFKNREKEIKINITPEKYNNLFGELSKTQLKIIEDNSSKYIAVLAGPGSGKTKLLVHKLASLCILEDVKHDQLLMLTFSRAAATEFKKRLASPDLLGESAKFIQISTFHSYCFDLLGLVASLEDTGIIIDTAISSIKSEEIEINKITKTVLVIDEAQDMSIQEIELVENLMNINTEMRVIAVGDDDQNIYKFRGSSSAFLMKLQAEYKATNYELLDNYRSCKNIVALANEFLMCIPSRLKKSPIKAVRKDDGEVSITKHISKNLSNPIVSEIIRKQLSGTTCVLTESNEEAFTVTSLLLKNNIEARLIQDNEGVRIFNLIEVRYFILALKLDDALPTISNLTWNNAKEDTKRMFSNSTAYEYVESLIRKFEEETPNTKYKSDFYQLIKESKFEDFCSVDSSQILVSTIHKAKGREFDNVFLMLKKNILNDDDKRATYVGMTRAKNNLYIHCHNTYFDGLNIAGITKKSDEMDYPEANEKVLTASYKGVKLVAFSSCQAEIEKLKSGDSLCITHRIAIDERGIPTDKYYGYTEDLKKVICFSKLWNNNIKELLNKGFKIESAKIRFIVWWKSKTNEGENKSVAEIKILLPEIYFVKL